MNTVIWIIVGLALTVAASIIHLAGLVGSSGCATFC